MKNSSRIFVIAAISFFTVTNPGKAIAQKFKGQQVVTLGAGSSLLTATTHILKNEIFDTDVSFSSTPVLIGSYDYGFHDHFSLGISCSYQAMNLSYNGVTNTGTGVIFLGNVTENTKHINMGVRPLYHFGKNERLDYYTGLRLSYSVWIFDGKPVSNENANTGNFLFDGFGLPVKAQAVFGMRYLFSEQFGFNAELGIGRPYCLMAGINYRFGNRIEKAVEPAK